MPTIHIRPTFFSEWLIFPWVLDTIVKEGQIALPYGEGRHAPIAAEDQARFIATVLAQPQEHIGKAYELCGPVEMDHDGIANEISKVIDRKIVYRPATLDEYRAHLQKYDLPGFSQPPALPVVIRYAILIGEIEMKIENSVVFVTVASRGPGLAFAREALARSAAKVYAGVRSEPGIVPIALDVTVPASVATRCE